MLPERGDKVDSFQQIKHKTVQDVHIQEFLEERTAVLINGVSPEKVEVKKNGSETRIQIPSFKTELINPFKRDAVILIRGRELDVTPTIYDTSWYKKISKLWSFGKKPSVYLKVGCAVAVAKDGFFLTAKHCVDNASVPKTLVFFDGDKVIKETVNVIHISPARDISLLHVNAEINKTFEIKKPPFKENEMTITLGFTGPACGHFEKTGFGQKFIINHTTPVVPSDSGGPTIDADGKLMGINSRLILPFIGNPKTQSVGLKPFVLKRAISNERELKEFKKIGADKP